MTPQGSISPSQETIIAFCYDCSAVNGVKLSMGGWVVVRSSKVVEHKVRQMGDKMNTLNKK
jgi:hypothetical protein